MAPRLLFTPNLGLLLQKENIGTYHNYTTETEFQRMNGYNLVEMTTSREAKGGDDTQLLRGYDH